MKILRAWDCRRNKIRYIHKNPETGNTVFGEVEYEWFFYVLKRDYEGKKEVFDRLKRNGYVNKYEQEHTYVKVFVDREHESESLDLNNNPVWEYYDKKKNKILEILTAQSIRHFEADISLSRRWILNEGIEYETELKTLFLDIETDDKNIKGQPIPGEFRILSIAFIDGETSKKAWLCADDNSDESEKILLQKVAKILNSYDVLIAWNGSGFDFPYLKVRMAYHGIQIDWRKKFLQDHLQIYKKYGPQLPSYSLDNVAKFVVKRGKIDHGRKIFQLFNNDKIMLREYNEEDCQLMFDIEKQTNFLAVARQINVVGLCVCDDIFVSRKIDNLIIRQAAIDGNYHFKTKEKQEEQDDEKQFIGAFVYEPKPGLYENVSVFDFASLYPNTIITFNISPDTIINPDDMKPNADVIRSANNQWFRKDIVGILPKLITMIADERNRYKKLLKTVDVNTSQYKTYYSLQYAWKALGLSFYGCMGNQYARFYDTRVAEAVTLGGQYMIKHVIQYLEQQHILVIGGDTDSCFIKLTNKELIPVILKNINKICQHIAIQTFNCDKSTLEMAHDKRFTKIIVLGKKRYTGFLEFIDDKWLDKPQLYSAGIELKRTDSCLLLRNRQTELLKLLLTPESITEAEAIKLIERWRIAIIDGKVTIDEISLGQKLTKPIDQYETELMHIKVAKMMMAEGKEVYIGDKISYFINGIDADKKPIPVPIYKFTGRFDKVYFWNNKFFPALQRILEVVFPKVNWSGFLFNDSKQKAGKKLISRTGLW